MKEQNQNLFWARLMIEELVRLGCNQFVICPGSRSTPLTVAAARHAKARTQIVHDERAGAYWAVGYARATTRPACVITTSGTAVANLMPAVVEASNDHIPLLLLTADRPPELVDAGANQAITQSGLFGQYVRWHQDMPCPTGRIDPAYVMTTVDQAVHRCTADHPGPVHLNCAYREPLMGRTDMPMPASLCAWQDSGKPYTDYAIVKRILHEKTAREVCSLLENTKKGLVLVGRLSSDAERTAVRFLIESLTWPVYADLASGLRLQETGTHIIRYFDQTLLPEAFSKACAPETVLHIGGRIVSKRVGLFLSEQRPQHFVQVVAHPDRHDPIHTVTCRLQGDIADIVSQIKPPGQVSQEAAYTDLFNASAHACDRIIGAHIQQDSVLTEPYVARRITELIPESTGLFVSSSMPIRDVDIYGVHGRDKIRVGVNRGVSGIDGILATAAGFAQGCGVPTTVLLGDLAMLHDLNSLLQAARSTRPLVIVVINNHGGGIFRFLPIAQHPDVFEDYFVTPHNVSFAGVANDFGLPYRRPDTKEAFDQAYIQAVQSRQTCVIEVVTDGQHSFELRKEMKQAMLAYFTGVSYESV
jgi:2-succinyl-5-enolpyruvyl-6-hydroxy-3-cyclohexene-1-carboxylate synthase